MESKIFMDNQSSIHLVKNLEFHNWTKHINMIYYYIHEQVNLGLTIGYMPSKELLADDLTKLLPAHRREEKLKKLGLT